jgi:hypothetical protein
VTGGRDKMSLGKGLLIGVIAALLISLTCTSILNAAHKRDCEKVGGVYNKTDQLCYRNRIP